MHGQQANVLAGLPYLPLQYLFNGVDSCHPTECQYVAEFRLGDSGQLLLPAGCFGTFIRQMLDTVLIRRADIWLPTAWIVDERQDGPATGT